MTHVAAPRECNVCFKPLDGRARDIHLGPVCLSCKINLRWAHYWLTVPVNSKIDFKNKYHHRTKKK